MIIGMEDYKTLKDEIVEAMKAEFGGRFDAIDERFKVIDTRFDAMDRRFDSMDERMDEGFRHQGVLIEAMQDDIDTLVEGQEVLHQRIDRVQSSVLRLEAKVEKIDTRLTSVEIA